MKNTMILISLVMLLGACTQAMGTDPTSPSTYEVVPATINLEPPTEPACGNGVKEAGEECDGDTFVTRNYCEDYGHTAGQVRCVDCRIDISGCTTCGDGVAEGGELCDLDDTHDQSGYVVTCEDRGYAGGNLMCNSSCNGYDESGCVTE